MTNSKINIIRTASLLGIITYALHHSALSGYFRLDDGEHLVFAALYSPWEYFFNPEITGQQSYYRFVTPWNALTYDINIFLFGLNPQWHYLTQLLMLWATGLATYLFLLRWCPIKWALFGALLFLAGGSTAYAAQELMDGHYILGLFFTILTIHFYFIALERNSFWFLLGSALFYLFAASSKEVYVPIIIIIPFLTLSNPLTPSIKARLYYFLPFMVVALFYIAWRYNVLGGSFIGGYTKSIHIDISTSIISKTLVNFYSIPLVLLGNNFFSYLLYFIIIALSIGYFLEHRNSIFIFFIAIAILLLPLIPVSDQLDKLGRYLLFPTWVFSVYLAILISNHDKYIYIQYILATSVFVITLLATYNEIHNSILKGIHKEQDIITQFILNSNSKQILYFSDVANWSLLATYVLSAEEQLKSSFTDRAKIVTDAIQLRGMDLEQKDVLSYDKKCNCIININHKINKLIRGATDRQKNKPLTIELEYSKPTLSWKVGPYSDGYYEFYLNINNLDATILNKNYFRIIFPRNGKIGFSPKTKLVFYVIYYSPEGWFTKSDILSFTFTNEKILSWSNNAKQY